MVPPDEFGTLLQEYIDKYSSKQGKTLNATKRALRQAADGKFENMLNR